MVNIPFTFKRTKESFDESARIRRCQSSGSDHSVEEDSAKLSDLVDSFIESDGRAQGEDKERRTRSRDTSDSETDQSERMELLERLLGVDNEEDGIRLMIMKETQLACRIIGLKPSDDGFKRKLMSQLRLSGLDAGICKGKKTSNFPGRDYEYIDVITSKTRYIVEVSLSVEFTIARPTEQYQSLLDTFPQIFVGRADELKEVIRLMCAAGKHSMRRREMSVPPWRRTSFMQAKWFGAYKRTTSAVTSRHATYSDEALNGNRAVGFEASRNVLGYCRIDLDSNVSMRVGNLARVLNG